jgi:hypothetical protein
MFFAPFCLFVRMGFSCCVLIYSLLCDASKTFFSPSKLYEILGNLTEGAHTPEFVSYMYIFQLFKIRFIKSTNLVAFITMVLLSSYEVASYFVYKVIKLKNCR